jgi:hypothetical protein
MINVITGTIAQDEATRMGWPFLQYSGSVTVIDSFFIRGGSVIISSGPLRLKQWEDGIPGIRWVQVPPGMGVTVTTATVMFIASSMPVRSVQLAGTGTISSIALPTILGAGGFLSVELRRTNVHTGEALPWFSNVGSIGTAGTGIIANTTQVDPTACREINLPNWGFRFQSSNSTSNIGDPAALVQGVTLWGVGTSQLLPFYHKVTIPAFSGFSDTLCLMFFEIPSATAQFTFSATSIPANFVRSVYLPFPAYRNTIGEITVNAQIFAPAWIPAAGNQVCAYVHHMGGSVIAPGFTTVHATGHVQGLKNTPQQKPIPVLISMQGSAAGTT